MCLVIISHHFRSCWWTWFISTKTESCIVADTTQRRSNPGAQPVMRWVTKIIREWLTRRLSPEILVISLPGLSCHLFDWLWPGHCCDQARLGTGGKKTCHESSHVTSLSRVSRSVTTPVICNWDLIECVTRMNIIMEQRYANNWPQSLLTSYVSQSLDMQGLQELTSHLPSIISTIFLILHLRSVLSEPWLA